jgi:hypothetical protein
MGYCIRVLSPLDERVAFDALRSKLSSEYREASLSVEEGTEAEWEQLLLRHPDGSEIAVLERNAADGDALDEEVREFLDEIADCQPASSVEWLRNYLPTVRTIYAFQILSGVESEAGWQMLRTLKSSVWREASGILQADGEGFSNEDGYHILWQFSDGASGEWWMGVLDRGRWVHFKMDLGDQKQKAAFLQGTVPFGIQLA